MKSITTMTTLILLLVGQINAQTTQPLLNTPVTLNVKNERLEEVLNQIENQVNATFTYSTNDINTSKLVSINVADQPLQVALDSLLIVDGIQFKVKGSRILLFKKDAGLTQTVRGTLLDQDTRQPLIGANIILIGSDPIKGGVTDIFGRFKIDNVPVGKQSFVASYLGYKNASVYNIAVTSGKELVLELLMEESVTALEEVIITADIDKAKPLNEMAMVSAKSFTVEETSRYAGSFNDPGRMATTYAGVVSATDDTENAIIIRGNSPKGLLWRLEGIEIPNPNHFALDGASSGAISMLNSNVLTNSDFLTGAFPAEYGNAFSGVFDLQMRSGNNEKREYALQAGLLGLDASLEGPFQRKNNTNLPNASYLVNYRYSTITLLESMGLKIAEGSDGRAQVPAFQDLALKINVPTKAGTFSLWGLGGLSDTQDYFTELDNGQPFELKTTEDYIMGIGGLKHMLNIGKNTFTETSFIMAQSVYKYLDEHVDESTVFIADDEDYKNNTIRLSTNTLHKFSPRTSIKAGFIWSRLGYNLNSNGRFNLNEPWYHVNQEGHMNMVQAFISQKYNISDEITITGGIHYITMSFNDEHNFEPRLAMQWAISDRDILSAGFGIHSRREATSLYLTELVDENGGFNQPNKSLGFSKARHYVVGYDHLFTNDFHLKLEAYYQSLYDIPISSNPESTFSTLNSSDSFIRLPLVNGGTGKNIGIELTFEKFFSNDYFFLLTGSVFNSTYGMYGNEYNTRFNRNYSFNFVGAKEFKLKSGIKQRTLRIGFESVAMGGIRVYPIDLNASIDEGSTVIDFDNPFDRQLDNYLRFDFQISIRTNKPKVTHEVMLDIQNVTGQQYVIGERYSNVSQTIVPSSFVGSILPVLSYKVTF